MDDEGPCTKPECVEALHEIYLFLDGELTEEKRVTITAHLDDCPPCGGAYDFELELRTVISRRCHDQVPEGLRAKIADVLSQLEP
jgi:mycothiol system anti-sigma-R factor